MCTLSDTSQIIAIIHLGLSVYDTWGNLNQMLAYLTVCKISFSMFTSVNANYISCNPTDPVLICVQSVPSFRVSNKHQSYRILVSSN